MTRRFDLSSPERQGRHDVPIEVLERLDREAQAAGITLLVIGAAARDLVIHALLDQPPHRATRDVDIAVATNSLEDHRVFLSSLSTAASSAHRVTVLGVTVDVVPFGAVEQSGQVRFEDDHLLDVTGLQEADAHADHVVVEPGLEVRVAPLEALATLKLLAWRDRRADSTKDAIDLRAILDAGSEGPYEDLSWADQHALDATDSDIILAGAYRIGRVSRAMFTPPRAEPVRSVLLDDDLMIRLRRDMGGQTLTGDLLSAYRAGFLGDPIR